MAVRIREFWVAAAFALFTPHANGAELKVLAPGAMRSALVELGPAFEGATGYKLSIQYGAIGPNAELIRKGEQVDVAILARRDVDEFGRMNLLLPMSQPDIAKVGAGVMAPKGFPKPDVSTVEKFKTALKSAKSIALADPASGSTGAHFAKLFESWGLTGELQGKIRLFPPGDRLYRAISEEKVELGLSPVGEILGRSDQLEFVGLVPTEAQTYNRFAAGVGAASKEANTAREFIEFLKSPEARETFRKKGLEPG